MIDVGLMKKALHHEWNFHDKNHVTNSNSRQRIYKQFFISYFLKDATGLTIDKILTLTSSHLQVRVPGTRHGTEPGDAVHGG